MLGLSTTAIGGRSFTECLSIYQTLKQPMSLDYLELAIGCEVEVDEVPADLPVILHDSCLYHKGRRLLISPFDRTNWLIYRDFCLCHKVLAFSIHPPKWGKATPEALLTNSWLMEKHLGVHVYLEVMPDDNWYTGPGYWKQLTKLTMLPVLLADISHINLWTGGIGTEEVALEVIKYSNLIHLSHNNGKVDSHDLIPEDIWFNHYIPTWYRKLVTYESLPEKYAEYERLDKKRRKDRLKESNGQLHQTKTKRN